MNALRNLDVKAASVRLIGVLLLGASMACGTGSTGAPADAATGPIVITSEVEYGPGAFNLIDPRAGLSELASYAAMVTVTFEGTIDGAPQNWKKVYSMLATNDPRARKWTIERTAAGKEPVTELLAELGGLTYRIEDPQLCTATAAREGELLVEELEPASFLPAVIGAEETGSESVNGIDTIHYTFDQRALGEDSISESTGELWIASEGGYVVKFVLTRQGNADALGEGVEGIQTLAYELTNANESGQIDPPEGCPAGLIDAPMLPDAAQVERSPGRLTYRSSSSIPQAAEFYQTELPNLGWTPDGGAAVTDQAAFINFLRGSQQLSLILTLADGQTEVQLLSGPQAAQP